MKKRKEMDIENQQRTEELSAKVNRLKHVFIYPHFNLFINKNWLNLFFKKLTLEMDDEIKKQNNFLGSMVIKEI